MKRNRIPGIIDWDVFAVGLGNLFLPVLTKIIDWLNGVLKTIIEVLEKSGNF